MESVMPSQPPESTTGEQPVGTVSGSRDPDLVALEGLESEFTELEVELERVDRPGRGTDAAAP